MKGDTTLRWIKFRVFIAILILLALFGLVLRRAYKLQTEQGERLRDFAEQQYLKEIELPSRRGTISDRHGQPLAISVEVDSVYANPRMIGAQAAQVAQQLAPILETDVWALQKQLTSRKYFVWLKRRISPKESKLVRELKLRGVYLTKESRRFYPNHGVGATVVGFAGLDAKGLEGIELSYDEWLRGSSRRVGGLRDALGREVQHEGLREQDDTVGHDVQLTLDKFIQFETELAIAEAYKSVRQPTGWVAALVLDVKSGDILAMASMPSFDPNRYFEAKPQQWRNRTVADSFEPGSTMKAFSVGAGLEFGVTNLNEVFDCGRGAWRMGRYTIHDAHALDKLDVAGVIKKSSNIGTAKIALRLGKQQLYRTLKEFGFGQKTGIELPGEQSGVLRSPKRWADITLANIAFGHGLSATALQLAQAYGALANDGVMIKPRIVMNIRDQRGQVVQETPTPRRQVFSAGGSRRMLKLLVGVTEKGGTAMEAALSRYTVAGKTGTAQKVDPKTGKYAEDRWVSSFIGVTPASSPSLAIVVVVNEPAGDKHYGGEVAGPIFRQIAGKALAYLGVKPDKAGEDNEGKGSKTKMLVADSAREMAAPTDDYVEAITEEEMAAPPLPDEFVSAKTDNLPHNDDTPTPAQRLTTVPDFTGMSMAEVITSAAKAGLKLELLGSGRAVAQSPGPGAVPRDTMCRVELKPQS